MMIELTNKIVKDLTPTIKRIASVIYSKYKYSEDFPDYTSIDDLVSWGLKGLRKAGNNYSSNEEVSFDSYARIKIRDNILEELGVIISPNQEKPDIKNKKSRTIWGMYPQKGKLKLAIKLLNEGIGIRATSRRTGLAKNTVTKAYR